MGMLEMLAKVVGAEELLRLVALSKFVHLIKMLCSNIPLWWIGKLFAAIAAEISATRRLGGMESGLSACKNSTAPAMAAKMEGVLVSLGFVFVLEAVRAVGTGVLLL